MNGQYFGTGDPNNPDANTTGVGMQQPGTLINGTRWVLFTFLAGVLQFGVDISGRLLAGANAVILDALGITALAGSTYSDAVGYKFSDGTNLFAKLQAYADAVSTACQMIMSSVSGKNNIFNFVIDAATGKDASFSVLIGGNAGFTVKKDGATGKYSIGLNTSDIDCDVQVHGATDQYLGYFDASANRLGVGTNTPTEKLDVVGNIKASGTLAASNFNLTSLGGVPTTRTLTGTAPIAVDGDNAAHDLSANRTISIAAATTSAPGSMSAADKTKLDGVTSGTYTPGLHNTTNVAASTAHVCQYMRVGNVVTVSGYVEVDPTSTGNTVLGIDLPIASNFSALEQCGGAAAANAVSGQSAGIYADSTNDWAVMRWVAVDTANRAMHFSFTYLIV